MNLPPYLTVTSLTRARFLGESLKEVTAPSYEPVTLDDMKAWFRIELTVTDHDAVLRLLRQAMREDAEDLTGRVFAYRTFRYSLPAFPLDCDYGYRITLPAPPLRAVTAFEYIDANGATQTLAASSYTVHDEDDQSRAFIIPALNASWPSLAAVPNAVQISYAAGYPVGSPNDERGYQEFVPAKMKLWMEAKANTMNEYREQIISGTIMQPIPRNFTDGLLDSLIVKNRFA